MKLKALLLALCTAGFAVSIAVAASPATTGETASTGTTTATTASTSEREGKGKQRGEREAGKTGKHRSEVAAACKPRRAIVLKGEFVAAGAGGFAMKVLGGNRAAKRLKGTQVTVLVDERSRFKGRKDALVDFVAGDRIQVLGRMCKAEGAPGTVLARKVFSRAPKSDHDGETKTTAGSTAVGTTTTVTTPAP